jgi:hypothetical protein
MGARRLFLFIVLAVGLAILPAAASSTPTPTKTVTASLLVFVRRSARSTATGLGGRTFSAPSASSFAVFSSSTLYSFGVLPAPSKTYLSFFETTDRVIGPAGLSFGFSANAAAAKANSHANAVRLRIRIPPRCAWATRR